MEKTYYLPAEWHKQSYIQLTWPHADTDWAYMLDEVETCFVRLATEIASRQPLLLVAPEFPAALADFPYRDQITFVKCPTNDTWARDHAFITLMEKHSDPQLLDFCFNGWGMKFAAHKDNLINSHLFKTGVLNGDYINCRNFVLEGGSIESDGEGTLLTTSPCLLAPNRNDTLSRKDIEAYLMERFNLRQVLWLDYGYLAGDDTDSHVDTRPTTPLPTCSAWTRMTSTTVPSAPWKTSSRPSVPSMATPTACFRCPCPKPSMTKTANAFRPPTPTS